MDNLKIGVIVLAIVILVVILVKCGGSAQETRSPQSDIMPPSIPDDKEIDDSGVVGWPYDTEPPFEGDRRPILPTWRSAQTARLVRSPQPDINPPSVPDDKEIDDSGVVGWPYDTEPPFEGDRRPILPMAGNDLKKKSTSISLKPCTWGGEQACVSHGLPDGIFPQYPEVPFNNPYPFYDPAAEEDYLNPTPNPPRSGVVPEMFSGDTWNAERWKPESAAWVYKDVTGKFPSVIDMTRKRYYTPPFSQRQPPYYLMGYPGFPEKQSFYKSGAVNEPVTNPAWPYTVVPLAGAGARGLRPAPCADERNYHDFVSERRSYL